MRCRHLGPMWVGVLVACSSGKSGSAPADDNARTAPVAVAIDAAAPAIDAGPPPLVDVTITAVTTPDKVTFDDFGRRGVDRPKRGQKLVVVSTQLTFSRCVDPPGDASWKKKVKKGEAPGPEPRLIRIANIHGVLVVPGHDQIAAHGFGSSARELRLSSYTETGYPCDDPDHGRPAIAAVFLFAVPVDTDLAAVSLSFRGTRVPLPPAT